MRSKAGLLLCITLLLIVGCKPGVTFLPPDQQRTIDRSIVDYPPSFDLKPFAQNLNCPTGFCFDPDGAMFIVEGGIGKEAIHIFGKRPDGSTIEIYPVKTRVPFLNTNFKIYGPIGGIAANNGKIFVSHRDANDMGVITAFNYDGTHATVVSEIPAQGDNGITDIAIRPSDGRLFFGVGAATNSGVVGLDNEEWLKKHPFACDVSPVDLKLYGLKFRSNNPLAGVFGGGSNTAVTAPFQMFNSDDKTRIPQATNSRANSCVYSVSPTGGDLTLESYGIRLPRGIAFNEYAPYATNDGMEMRGTRPIANDPDALIKIGGEAYFGFPDFSSDGISIADKKYQPPDSLLTFGYHEVNALIDRDNSNLPRKILPPSKNFLFGVFPPQAGAAKFDFIPEYTTLLPYRKFAGRAIVALSGDRAPFSTSGLPVTNGPVGYKVVSLDIADHKVTDFIYNVRGVPASKMGHNTIALERPCDVKMGPEGALYILDLGQMTVNRNGTTKTNTRTGRIFKLVPIIEPERPTTRP